MSMPTAVRHINQSRLLRALQHSGPLSRAAIARELDVMRSTAGSLVTTLLAEGMVREVASDSVTAPAREVGRPGTLIELNPAHAHFLGADVGVGYVRLVLLDLQAKVIASECVELDVAAETPEVTATLLASMVRAMVAAHQLRVEGIRGLCFSVPGLIDRSGTVKSAPILGWKNVPFLAHVTERLPMLTSVLGENDANAFAQSELLQMDADGPGDILFLWLDAGVGGAILSGGTLLRGHNGYAGEFGHMYVGESDIDSGTPLPGSLESFVGREAILRRNRLLGGQATGLDELLLEFDAAVPAAVAAVAVWSKMMARGLANLTSLLNPARIIVGGPVAQVFARCLPQTRQRLHQHLIVGDHAPELLISKTGGDGAAIGCALLLHKAFLEIDHDFVFGGGRAGVR